MLAIIGVLVILGCCVGGFAIEGGNVALLIQPIEWLIIFGIAFGAFLIANPMHIVTGSLKAMLSVFTHKSKTKNDYQKLLCLLYVIFQKIRKDGLIAVEQDVENPHKSKLFEDYPEVTHDHHLLNYICDNIKVIISTKMSSFELDDLMSKEVDSIRDEENEIAHAINRVGDSLPGLGIVAAVLGIVLTMGYITETPEVIGHHVAVALLGTFMGILACYGFLGPIAVNLEHRANESVISFNVVKAALVATVNESVPMMAVEFARRAIPAEAKPTCKELEDALKGL